ncbi:transmembrane protein 72 isoform X2 [Pelodiscus sinensis]|uniref:transmembrane protein 72 isoform X2 n=1 Tax=Pelodiscus sinensis TaxID=13735 RepID=UPI003F6C3B82
MPGAPEGVNRTGNHPGIPPRRLASRSPPAPGDGTPCVPRVTPLDCKCWSEWERRPCSAGSSRAWPSICCSMLVLTGLAYFLLSKRRKSPAHGAAQGPRELYVEPCAVDPGGDAEQTFTFPRGRRQQRPSLLGRVQNSLRGSEGPAPPGLARQVHFQEALVRIIPAVSESQAEGESEAEETTSDTAPILGPLDSPLLVTPLGATGPF